MERALLEGRNLVRAQLLELGIFPCSDESPRSGFTISLLRQFGIFSALGKGSAHKFYAILERCTSTGFPGSIPDRYRELLATHRRFSYLLALKRSGSAFPKHPNPAYEDDLALRCPACPNPEVNFKWVEVDAEEFAFMRFWMSYDGNFRNPRKAKKVDKDDLCFTDGVMYYVEQSAYQQWLEFLGSNEPNTSKNRPECDNHKAAHDKFVRWGGLDVTGVGALVCARHSLFLPRGFVDFRKGERFAYGDYGFASAVNWLGRHGHLSFGLTYDIWCHWITNFKQRAALLPSHIALPDDLQLVGGIPKFHLQGHADVCWVRYSLNNMSFVGRIEGEGIERAWAHLNETSGSTSEKSPGARWDSINLILGDWNFEKIIRMASFLRGKFLEAKKMYPKQRDIFIELDESLPKSMTEIWRSASTEPTQLPSGKWSSPFQATELAGENFQEAIQRETSQEQAAASSSPQRTGIVKWLSTAIELEYSMELLRREVEWVGSTPTPRQHNSLNDRRKTLNERIGAHRTKQAAYMGDIGPPDHPEKREVVSADPEYAELGLPSSYKAESLRINSLEHVKTPEINLRRATCNDALQAVRNLLGAKALALKFKRKNIRGEKATTRAEATLRDHAEKVSRAQWKYNNSRSALLRLSCQESDVKTYLPMRSEDLKLLKSYLEEDSQGLGQGYQSISWVWRSSAAQNEEGWQVEALKTEWFRSRQRYLQWEEELKILKREMVMTIRDFATRSEIWKFKSECEFETSSPGMAEYARRKSHFYQRLKEDVIRQCLPLIKDPIVELKWAVKWCAEMEGRANEKDL